MRTTIRIDDQLLKEAKVLAARNGKSLSSFIEDALRESLARRRSFENRETVRLPTFDGNGLLPGVDLDHSTSLQDILAPPIEEAYGFLKGIDTNIERDEPDRV